MWSDIKWKEQEISKRKNRAALIRELVSEYKIEKGCKDCGYNSFPEALDFDHVIGTKCFNIGEAIAGTYSLEKLLEEINKCEIVCSNCHRVRTKRRRNINNV